MLNIHRKYTKNFDSDDAKRWHKNRGRPIPGGDSLLTATKAAWALASLLVKCGVVYIEGVNQYPSQRTSSLGWKMDPSRWIGEREIGPLSLMVHQWMSSVLGMEKLTPTRPLWPSVRRSASVGIGCSDDGTSMRSSDRSRRHRRG